VTLPSRRASTRPESPQSGASRAAAPDRNYEGRAEISGETNDYYLAIFYVYNFFYFFYCKRILGTSPERSLRCVIRVEFIMLRYECVAVRAWQRQNKKSSRLGLIEYYPRNIGRFIAKSVLRAVKPASDGYRLSITRPYSLRTRALWSSQIVHCFV